MLSILAGCACALSPISSVAASLRVGVLLKNNYSPFWVSVGEGASKAGQEDGAQIVLKGTPNLNTTTGAQRQLLAGLVKSGIDALVIGPVSTDNIAADVAALKGTGTKIVTVDSPLPDGIADAHVEIDQAGMSEAAVRMFLPLFSETDEVAVLRNNQIDPVTSAREQYIISAIKARYPHLVVHSSIYAGNAGNTEEEFARRLIDTYPHTKAILTSATDTTIAMLTVLKSAGLAGKIHLVGFGTYLPEQAAAALKNGEMDGWIAQEPGDLGYTAVDAALKLLRGEQVDPVIHTRFLAVTKATLGDPAVKELIAAGGITD